MSKPSTTRERTVAALALVAGLSVATACAINPATGKRQIMLVSEAQEIEIGRESDRSIVASLGLYPDDELQQYVQELGQSLAANSERPHLDWTFRVVDDPVINAFALPGGYIYITRGIMAYMDSEAQLASVVGHEIGHVTARHGVNQMSKQQLAQGLMGLGMAVSEEFRDWSNLASQGMGLLFLKYSRDDERQADDLGLRYLYGSGYDPRPMAGMYTVLERASEGSEAGSVPVYMLTHPYPENRRERIEEQIAQLPPDFSGRPTNRERYLHLLNDLAFGEDPREGFFDDNVFLHPDLQFKFAFPQGWKTQNSRQAVAGMSPGEDALIVLSLAREDSAEKALQAFWGQEGITAGGQWRRQIHGFSAASGGFSAQTQQGAVRGLVAFVEFDNLVLQLIGYAGQANWEGYRKPVQTSLGSFDRLRDQATLDAQPKRIRVIRADRDMSLEEFARRYNASVDLETLAKINQLEEGARLESGQLYKIVRGGRRP